MAKRKKSSPPGDGMSKREIFREVEEAYAASIAFRAELARLKREHKLDELEEKARGAYRRARVFSRAAGMSELEVRELLRLGKQYRADGEPRTELPPVRVTDFMDEDGNLLDSALASAVPAPSTPKGKSDDAEEFVEQTYPDMEEDLDAGYELDYEDDEEVVFVDE